MKTETNIVRSRQRGFSLVELLVVLALAAMVAGIVIINAPPGRSDIRRTAERLAARLDFAAQEAVTASVVIGMRLGDDGYEFYRYERGEWIAETAPRMKAETFPAAFSVLVEKEAPAKKNEQAERRRDDKEDIRPTLRFLPTGETTPVTVLFQDRRERWRVMLDASGDVEVSDEDGA